MRFNFLEMKALENEKELNRFIDNSSVSDLESLSIKLDDLIELLFLNGYDDTEEYTKAINNQATLDIAIMFFTNTKSSRLAK
jgi:hypothetical protein